MIRSKLLIIFILQVGVCISQQNLSSYSILNNNCTSRNSSLGGYPIGVFDSDASLSIFLPSNLNNNQNKQLVLNYNNHFADSDFGMVNYNFKIKDKGVFSTTLFYNNYGEFDYYDASGLNLGNSFSANDWVFQIGHSKDLHENLKIGVNLKFISSVYERYKSYAIGSDFSLTYFNDEKQIGAYLLVSNIGTTIKDYNESLNYKSKLPLNSIIGLNTKLKHAPIRFHVCYHHLNNWNISQSNNSSEDLSSFRQLSSNFFNHLVFASELLFSDNFNIRFGYDIFSRKELQPQSRPGTTGLSWGVGFKVKKLKINYSNSKYHFAGTSNNITIIKQLKT